MAKKQLHQSSLSMLERCPMQFYYRYIENVIIPPAVAMVTGTGTHRSVECDMAKKIETGKLEDLDRLKDVAAQAVKAEFERGVTIDEEDKGRPLVDIRDESIRTAQDLGALHHDDLAPSLKPVAVERKWVLELTGHPYDLAGTIDLQEADSVRDTKTSKKTKNQAEADNSQQLTMYALAVKVIDQKMPSALYLDNLVALKTPKRVTLSTTRDDQDLQILLRRIERASEVIDAGKFMPCDPTSWVCTERFCGFWSRCEFSKKPVSVPVKKGD